MTVMVVVVVVMEEDVEGVGANLLHFSVFTGSSSIKMVKIIASTSRAGVKMKENACTD